jgi:hypothetical protein
MKAGIVCDNYKVDTFKKELDKAKFNYKTSPFTSETTTIQVETEAHRIKELHKLCLQTELKFKRSN